MPAPNDWQPGNLNVGSPVWKEIVPGEHRAITLRHPSYPYVVEWVADDAAALITIAAGYLEKVRHLLALPELFAPHTPDFKPDVPLDWLPLGLDDLPGPHASVWARRFREPIHQVGLIDRTAVILAVQTMTGAKKWVLRSRLGIRIVMHVSPEAPHPKRTVRITGVSCSRDLAKSLGPQAIAVSNFLTDFFADVHARSALGNRIRALAGLADDAPVKLDGVRVRGDLIEIYHKASRLPDEPHALTYGLTATYSAVSDRILAVTKSPLVAGVVARLFRQDPASEPLPIGTGQIVDARPNRAPARLERYRQGVNLPGLVPNPPGDVDLIDDLEQVEVMQSELIDPDRADDTLTQNIANPAGVPHARTNEFGALSGYQRARDLFDTMRGYNLSPAEYFKFAGWPLRVRFRATIRPGSGKDGRTVNAQVDYDPPGEDAWPVGNADAPKPLQVRFALADLKRSASGREPLGLAADPRWSWHEYGHVLLAASTGALELRFVHSAGDALAAIRSDPESVYGRPVRVVQGQPVNHRLRFATFPWVYLNRRHDRSVWHGWSWSGTYHRPARFAPDVENRRRKGYESEQILSTSLFRLYRALGGDTLRADGTPDAPARQTAAHYTVYLIMRAIESLPPALALLTETPDQLVAALGDADIGTLASFPAGPLAEKVGGCAYKVAVWAFEAQGLGAAPNPLDVVNAPGPPPDVDIFIDNGRPDSEGLHPRGGYMPVSLDWNVALPAWHARANAVHVAANKVKVQVRNRGRLLAAGVRVRIWYVNWPAATPPPKWDPARWTMVGPSAPQPVPADGNPVMFGPIALPPAAGRRLILAEASCTADYANTDAGSQAPCAATPTPLVDLVAGDNNLGLRVQ